jgi:hypothetical protein
MVFAYLSWRTGAFPAIQGGVEPPHSKGASRRGTRVRDCPPESLRGRRLGGRSRVGRTAFRPDLQCKPTQDESDSSLQKRLQGICSKTIKPLTPCPIPPSAASRIRTLPRQGEAYPELRGRGRRGRLGRSASPIFRCLASTCPTGHREILSWFFPIMGKNCGARLPEYLASCCNRQ